MVYSKTSKYASKKGKYTSRAKKVANKDIGRAKRLSVINAPLSRTLKAQMLYTSNQGITLVSVGSNPGTHVFSLNSLFDPDFTGAGHQPRGYDQLMLMYDHYTVINCKVRIDAHNNEANRGAYIIATVRDSGTTSNNFTDYTESLNSQWKILGVEASGSADKNIMLNINPNEFLGRSHSLADPDLKGGATSSPIEQAFLHVSGMGIDQFTACSINVMVTLEYTVILTEPKQPAQS